MVVNVWHGRHEKIKTVVRLDREQEPATALGSRNKWKHVSLEKCAGASGPGIWWNGLPSDVICNATGGNRKTGKKQADKHVLFGNTTSSCISCWEKLQGYQQLFIKNDLPRDYLFGHDPALQSETLGQNSFSVFFGIFSCVPPRTCFAWPLSVPWVDPCSCSWLWSVVSRLLSASVTVGSLRRSESDT